MTGRPNYDFIHHVYFIINDSTQDKTETHLISVNFKAQEQIRDQIKLLEEPAIKNKSLGYETAKIAGQVNKNIL